MKNSFFVSLVISLFISVQTSAQNSYGSYSVLFYNVENLFDLEDDPETSDEEFTPGGDRHWTYNRLTKKLLGISKVILGSAGWEPPQMIGLCEVENRRVLENLVSGTPLNKFPYKIIHKESPDHRGIDVAFIYNQDVFYPLFYRYFPLKSADGSELATREILYISGVVNETDTLHFFVNHWPSRYGGLLETQPLRNLAAKTLRFHFNQLCEKYRNPKVIIMGDFNDQPADESISVYLGAAGYSDTIEPDNIVNLSAQWVNDTKGTLKYRSQWSVFDQIMVSGALLNADQGLFATPEMAQIVDLPFLLQKDERFGGMKTNRTYVGYSYNGGFSDHLPVLIQLGLSR